nr:reverse transcriptase domain-containing protein [Tanacetum cinerariifolium]
MLERLAKNKYVYFLDGFSGYFRISIDPMDQEKTTFTCPFGTYACRRIPLGLCNAPATFQRCMLEIFHDMIEESVEVFMDDFSIFGNSFDKCLNNLLFPRVGYTTLNDKVIVTLSSLKWQLSSGNAFALTVGKCTSSGIFITSSGNDLEHFIPNTTLIKCSIIVKMLILSLIGKISLHGQRRNCAWTQGVWRRT